jgi:hypothetical protein
MTVSYTVYACVGPLLPQYLRSWSVRRLILESLWGFLFGRGNGRDPGLLFNVRLSPKQLISCHFRAPCLATARLVDSNFSVGVQLVLDFAADPTTMRPSDHQRIM